MAGRRISAGYYQRYDRKVVYEVAHRQDFPTITLGSRIIVPRDKFMAWIDEQAAKKTEIF